jgi:hypothetical protein
MLAGLSGGTTSIVPSRSLAFSEVSRRTDSRHKEAEYGSSCGGLRNFGCDAGVGYWTIVWNVVPPFEPAVAWLADGGRLVLSVSLSASRTHPGG